MLDPNVIFYEVANFLLTVSWIAIAAMLWRVRHLKLLDGGCPVIVWTLVSYAVLRLTILFGYSPLNIPLIMAVVSGLTITSAIVIVTVLARVARENPAPQTPTLELFKALSPEAVKVYAEIKNGDAPWNSHS